MSTIANLVGQTLPQTRGAVERTGDAPTGRSNATATSAPSAPVQDQVQLSASASTVVTAEDASQGIKGGAGQAAVAHQVPAELMALLDELDELGV